MQNNIFLRILMYGMQINPRISASMVIKSMLILGTVATSFYGAFFGFQSFAVRYN